MPKPKVVKKVGSVAKPKFKYHLEIEVNDSVYKADSNDLHQALKDFHEGESFPFPFKTRLKFLYSSGKVQREKVYFSTIDSKRIFENKTALELLANTMTKELG